MCMCIRVSKPPRLNLFVIAFITDDDTSCIIYTALASMMLGFILLIKMLTFDKIATIYSHASKVTLNLNLHHVHRYSACFPARDQQSYFQHM